MWRPGSSSKELEVQCSTSCSEEVWEKVLKDRLFRNGNRKGKREEGGDLNASLP